MKRQQKAPAGAEGVPLALICEELILYPALAEFLFLQVWEEDQAPRETGTVLMFSDGCHLKAMLNDRAQGLVAFLTLDPTEEVLVALDKAVLSTGTDWRPSKKQSPRK